MDAVILWGDHSWAQAPGPDRGIAELGQTGYQKYLGPYVIAQSLRSRGYSVAVLDITGMDYPTVTARVLSMVTAQTLWVGVSTTFLVTGSFGIQNLRRDWPRVMAFSSRIREQAPKCQFLAGGYFATAYRRLGWWIMKNHSDESIIDFTDWSAGRSPLYSPGKDRSIEGNHNRRFIDTAHQWTDQDGVQQGESLPMEISRGCRFSCAFCRYNLNGRAKNDYIRSELCLTTEIKNNHQQWAVNRYTLGDDTFNEDTDKLKKIASAVDQSAVDFRFSAYLRLDILESHPEQISILKDMGIENAMFGIESLDLRNGRAVGKSRDPRRQLDFLADLKAKHWPRVGLHSGFILGLPWDQPGDSAQALVDLAVSKDCPLDSLSVEALNIIRPAWKKIWGENNTLSQFDRSAEDHGYTWLDPKSGEWTNTLTGMTASQAHKDAHWAIEQIYKKGSQTRIAGFHFNRLYNIGVAVKDLESLNLRQLNEKYNLVELSLARLK